MADEQQDLVARGYDAVYAAMANASTLRRVWREHVLGPEYPEGFEHISLLTPRELRRIAESLRLSPGSSLVDLGCGMGGPGLWVARETKARLTGIDLSAEAVAQAAQRAANLGLADIGRFATGSFAATGLPAESADAVMSMDALQYAPDKRAAFAEISRILRPGGRLVFAAFELDPERAAQLPVLGVDPVADYRPLLKGAGFVVDVYEQMESWQTLLTATYQAVAAEKEALMQEMGEIAATALLTEITLTLERRPYRGHVMVCATKE